MQYSGITLTPGFVITAATDPQFNYVTALLHGDGASAGTNNTFLDSSPNNLTLTRNGSTTQGTFTPFGTLWSAYNPNSDNGIGVGTNAVLSMGTGDFTVEAWVNTAQLPTSNTFTTSAGGYQCIFGTGPTQSATGTSLYIGVTNLFFDITSDGSGPINVAHNMVPGQWYHVAITRSGTTFRAFINGSLVQTATSSASWNDGYGYGVMRSEVIGGYSGAFWYGYVSNFRVTKGGALYTTSFTPSTAPLTTTVSSGTVSLLLCQSNRFKDNSVNSFTVLVNNTPSIQRYSPFGTTTQYDPATIGGSGYFNGSTDYLTAPTGTAFQFAGDFTMEAWVYSLSATGQANYSCIFDTRATNTSSTTGIVVNLTPSGYLNFYINGTNYTSATLLGANNWTHVALVRSGSTISMYQNGVSVASVSYATSLSSGYFWAGALAGPAASGYWQGYISNLRVVNGTAVYTATFTPPTIPLPSIGNTSLLLSGINGQIFGSTMTNNFVTVSNAQVSTSIYKYGTGSIFFNGTTDYLTAPSSPLFAFGTGAWTVEAWVYVTTLQEILIFDTRTSGSTAGVGLRIEPTTGKLTYSGSANNSLTGTGSTNGISANIWTHIAWVYDGVTLTGYINGQISGSATPSFNITQNNCVIGRVGFASSGFMAGYIDEFRITNGIARYTANFTAPTSQFPSTGPIPIYPPTVQYLVVAGGGGGGSAAASSGLGGGGGAGGFRTNVTGATSGGGGSAESAYTVTGGTAITVTVGAGGTAVTGNNRGNTGNNSVFGTITSAGGGGGSSGDSGIAASIGGSGGGGGNGGGGVTRAGAAGTSLQGYSGGTSTNPGQNYPASGGGGAGAAGSANPTNLQGGAGGAGVSSSITGSAVTYGGGGGGGINTVNGGASPGAGGAGGGGAGGINTFGTAGTVNTGGGGGGSGGDSATGGGGGGSGIVIVRYPSTYQLAASTTGSPAVAILNGYNIYTWTSSGSITF